MLDEYKDPTSEENSLNNKIPDENLDDGFYRNQILIQIMEKCRETQSLEDWEELMTFISTQDGKFLTEEHCNMLIEITLPALQEQDPNLIKFVIFCIKEVANTLEHPRKVLADYEILPIIVNFLQFQYRESVIPILNIIELYITDDSTVSEHEKAQAFQIFQKILELSFNEDKSLELFKYPLFNTLFALIKVYPFSNQEANDMYMCFACLIRNLKNEDPDLTSKINALRAFLAREPGFYTNFSTDGMIDQIFNFVFVNDDRAVKASIKCMMPVFTSQEITDKYVSLGIVERILEKLEVPSLLSMTCYRFLAILASISDSACKLITSKQFLSRPQLYRVSSYKEKRVILSVIHSLITRGYFIQTPIELKYIPNFLADILEDTDPDAVHKALQCIQIIHTKNDRIQFDINEILLDIINDDDYPEEIQALAQKVGDFLNGVE